MPFDQSAAVDHLFSRHYDELRLLARARLRREGTEELLQATDLVNEAYLRLGHLIRIHPDEKRRFFALMSTAMRRVLIDHARRRRRLKRGAGAQLLLIDDADTTPCAEPRADELMALDEALAQLDRANPRGAAVVRHHVFTGLSLHDIAARLGVSVKTVQREWRWALAWLRRELERDLAQQLPLTSEARLPRARP